MNCFDWQNRASDYMDGALIGGVKDDADRHLDSCTECSQRFRHYRAILDCISSQPRSTLPIPIRKTPFRSGLSWDTLRISRARWDRVPWFVRTALEGAGIVLMILLGISAGPKIRTLYERGMEANLEELTLSFRDWRESLDKTDRGAPLTRGKPLTDTTPATAGATGAQTAEDFSSGDADSTSDDDSSADDDSPELVDGDIRVGNSEIWRFMIKTDSPHEFRTQVVHVLEELKIPADTPGIGGVEAPGGIQFDLLLLQSQVAPLKRQLEAIAPKTPEELAQSPVGETFTWYKNKSKHPLPAQKTRVVIWLSQL